MRSFIVILILALSGCGSDNDSVFLTKTPADNDGAYALRSQLPPNESTQVAALQAQIVSLQQQMKSLQLIGKPHGVTTDAIGRRVDALGNPVSFGPCTDMGVLVGRGGQDSFSPLASSYEAYQTCTGYDYIVNVFSHKIAMPVFVAWDGPNCTGNILIETDVDGDGYNPQVIQNGVVFSDPETGNILMIPAAQASQPRMIQSSLNTGPNTAGCGPDQELRMTVTTQANDTSVTGVLNTDYPDSTLGSP